MRLQTNQPNPAVTLLLSLLLLLTACGKKNVDSHLLVSALPSDFEDVLTVDGVAQSVRSYVVSTQEDVEAEVVYLVEDGTMVDSGQVVCVLECADLQQEYDELQVQLEGYDASMNKTKADLALKYALLEAQVKNNEAQSAMASLDSLQLEFATPRQKRLKALEMERSAIEKEKLQRKLVALGTINESQIKKQQLQIERCQLRIQSAKGKLEKLKMVAPISGLANRGISWMTGEMLQVGDQAWATMPLVNIPNMTNMKVTILASETHYKRIQLNDSVAFTFDAMPGNTAWGRITTVSPVGRPVSRQSKIKVFEIEASIQSAKTMPKPGLSANARIYLKRIPNVIVLPQLTVFDNDSIKVVYVKQGKGYEERQVIIGESSPKEAVIIAGLKGSEFVSLVKPSATRIKQQTRLPAAVIKKYRNVTAETQPTDIPQQPTTTPISATVLQGQ